MSTSFLPFLPPQFLHLCHFLLATALMPSVYQFTIWQILKMIYLILSHLLPDHMGADRSCKMLHHREVFFSLRLWTPSILFFSLFFPSLPGACVRFWPDVMEAQPTGGTTQVKVYVRWETEARPYKEWLQAVHTDHIRLFVFSSPSLFGLRQHQLALASHLYICVSEPSPQALKSSFQQLYTACVASDCLKCSNVAALC